MKRSMGALQRHFMKTRGEKQSNRGIKKKNTRGKNESFRLSENGFTVRSI